MIPILSSIIAGQGSSITTSKAFTLSLVYVLSMAATYAIAGAIVGYYGAEFNIQIWFQDPIILSIFAAVFVLLALSMFGFYELQMPNAIQSRLTAISNSQQGGTLVGVGLMGLFSAIIVGPCITAPLVGALIFISQTQDWQLGGLALFALGLGMGVPLLLIGTSAGKLLPRAGGWMDSVKAVFGVVLLGVAIWLLERILPVGITMSLIAALLIASAIYLGALDSLSDSASGWHRLLKSIGLLILVYGIAYLIGAAAGSNDLIQPLRGITASTDNPGQTEQHLAFRQIKGQKGLQLALNDSIQQDRTTMLDFYADWCISCKEMEKYAFSHPRVLTALENVATLQADVTDNDNIDTELMTSLGIYGPPAILFFDSNGQEIRNRRVVGEMSGERFADHVVATFQ
jgi:thiol:disulfide interchange protein DsbD